MRKSGVLLHITSLPSKGGIGTLGRAAYEFVDFVKSSGMNLWQVLPAGPTGYAESPYQSASTYAGNPLMIDFEMQLAERKIGLCANTAHQLAVTQSFRCRILLLRQKLLHFGDDTTIIRRNFSFRSA